MLLHDFEWIHDLNCWGCEVDATERPTISRDEFEALLYAVGDGSDLGGGNPYASNALAYLLSWFDSLPAVGDGQAEAVRAVIAAYDNRANAESFHRVMEGLRAAYDRSSGSGSVAGGE